MTGPLEEKVEEVAGGAKEVAGEATGDETLEKEGKAEKIGAKIKQAVSTGVEKAKDVISKDDEA